MPSRNKSAHKRWHIWRWPLLLASMTLVGLLAALLETGVWRVMSWLLLAVPLLALARHSFTTKRKK